MSLSSLRSLTGAASFATNALDTARSTFKAMADAAVPPAGADAAGGTGADTPGGRAPGVPVPAAPSSAPVGRVESEREADLSPAEKRKAGMRKGIALDAYACHVESMLIASIY